MAYNPHRRARISTIARNLGVDEAELCRRMKLTPGTVVRVSNALAHIREMEAARELDR
jgi:hypothetical protein